MIVLPSPTDPQINAAQEPTDPMIEVYVNPREEGEPNLYITRRYMDPYGAEIPESLLASLDAAEQAVNDAQHAIMAYVGEHYPERGDVREWLAEQADDQ